MCSSRPVRAANQPGFEPSDDRIVMLSRTARSLSVQAIGVHIWAYRESGSRPHDADNQVVLPIQLSARPTTSRFAPNVVARSDN